MNFFFDARYIRPDGVHDGVSRYTSELAKAVGEQAPDTTFLISDKRQLEYLAENCKHMIFHKVDSPLEPFSSLLLNKYRPDVVFSPMQTMGSLGRHFKLILTLHDLTYYRHRQPPPSAKGIVRPIWRLYHLTYVPQRLTLNAADMVATVSETSRDEIEAVHLTKRPLIVVSNAARDLTPLLKKPVSQGTEPPKNLVFMGSPIPHKNPETLITMMRWLPGRTLHILSPVKPERREALEKLIPHGAKVIFHGGVSDEAYARLLAEDAIMVSASYAEGFGLPLAEALQLGVPAVVSDRPFFHEVGGEAALYADPASPEDFAAKINSLDLKNIRLAHIRKGKAHVAKFSWKASATELLTAAAKLDRPGQPRAGS